MIEVGTTFGGYRLDQVLSTDTVSTIYRAGAIDGQDVADRPVAVRITHPLRTDEGSDAAAIAAYIRRVTDAVRVSHPALIPVADAGEHGDRVYAASGLFEATTLDSYVRDHGRLSPEAAVTLLGDLGAALDRAHAAGVVHGAIGPRTILVRPPVKGVATSLLRGFGIDVLLARQVRLDRSAIDVLDVAYTSPERLRGSTVDGRADQYALACALYHCLTGHLPFGHDTVGGLIGAHLFTAPPTSALIDAHAALGGALMVGMSKRPEQRHDSCMDLLRATGHAASVRPSSASAAATAPATPAPGSLSRWRSSSPVAWPDDGPRAGGDRSPTGRTRGHRGRRASRRPASRRARTSRIAWPVAAMVVLLGIIATLVVAAMVRSRSMDVGGGLLDGPADVAAGSLAAADDGPAAAGVRWHRRVSGESLYAIEATGDDNVVVAWSHGAAAIAADSGDFTWRRPIEVGILTDLVASPDLVALRASKLRAFGKSDGAQVWERADIVEPVNSLTTDGDRIYGLGVGRLSPELVAIDAETGQLEWSFDGGGERIDDGATVVAGEDLIALVDDEALWAVDPDGPSSDAGPAAAGGARWRVEVERPWLDTLVLLPDVVSVATRTGQVCAYDPDDGAQRWCAPVAGISAEAPALIADRDVVAVVHGDRVTALAIESGATRWTYDAPETLTPIAASTGRQIVVADMAGGAHGLDLPTGFEVWRASGFGDVTALAATPGSVYAGTRAGLLVRLQPPAPDTSS